MPSPLQPVIDISALCARLGLQSAVISPGSRSAPLTLSFARHPEINTTVVPDERSAAFVALGMAQATKKPVAMICTSGSAAYNYAPAVAEAYFQQVPLVIFTADRPPEWQDQYDGQTIRQHGIYGQHCKKSYTLPVDFSHPDAVWHCHRSVSEAYQLSQRFPAGPVHINAPFREPFYPPADIPYGYSEDFKAIQQLSAEPVLSSSQWRDLYQQLHQHRKILLIAGQMPQNRSINTILQELSNQKNLPVIADVISNLHSVAGAIRYHDSYLDPDNPEMAAVLQPDLIISFGKSVISKNLKRFLRAHPPKAHWQVRSADFIADPFQSVTQVIDTSIDDFVSGLVRYHLPTAPFTYLHTWQQAEAEAKKAGEEALKRAPFGEFEVVMQALQKLEGQVSLHLANSMAVRYANFCGLSHTQDTVEVFANRGTSGIDGSTSTAVGYASKVDHTVLLITGDIAFFYDRNAFWQEQVPTNLRVILLNNHAGGIFRMINGPAQQAELERHFETVHDLNARSLAKEFGTDYLTASSSEELDRILPSFLESGSKARILEVESESTTNAATLKQYKAVIAAAVRPKAIG